MSETAVNEDETPETALGEDETPEPSGPLRVVMLVDNGVFGDSRVIKSARTAQAAGYDVVILGMGATQNLTISDVPVLLRPPLVNRPTPGFLARLGVLLTPSLEARHRRANARLRVKRARRNAEGTTGLRRVRALGRQGTALAREAPVRVSYGLRRRAALKAVKSVPKPRKAGPNRRERIDLKLPRLSRVLGFNRTWDHLDPQPVRLSHGWQIELIRLQPDLIHAHDYRTLPAALTYRRYAAHRGHPVKVVYDAHEWVQGYDELGPKRHEAAMRLERALINQADAVVTVAPDIARDLAASYGLDPVPPVVLNAPELPTGSLPGATLRERVRLGPDVPLLVYAGSVGKGRALDMVVEAMPQIPDAHLAFVVGAPDSAIMKELTARAVELGVRDRVHVTRYVDQEHVVDFVAEATLGLTPFRHNKNTESSLPTKVREYLQAGVPQVVSDCRTLSAFVRDNGLGEVHVADDVDSFAAAVNRALRDPSSYLAGITDELRREHSWQAQGEVLLEVYRQVTAGLEGRQRPSALPPPERFDRLVLPHADGRYPCRLVVGPINAAEQGWALGRAAERHLAGVQAVNVAVDSGKAYGFRATRVMTPQERSNKDWVSQFEREVKAIRTHALLECGSSLTGAIDAAAVGGHVVRLERAGLKVGLIAYGSEVRDPSWHLATYPWSAFANADPEFVAALQTRVDTTRPVLEWLGLPTFVSTLDLLDHVPWATWVPLTVDTEEFRSTAPVLERERPVVVHAPSSQALKGSAVIDPVLTALEAEGLIEYCRLGVRPDGEIAGREEVVERLRTADVVVDQLGLGLYSTLSCEAMAAGRLVLAQVGDAIRGRSPEPVPIVEIDAATLEETVRRVVDDRESYRQVAKQGAEFALRYHDGRAAAAALAPFLGTAVRER